MLALHSHIHLFSSIVNLFKIFTQEFLHLRVYFNLCCNYKMLILSY